MQAAAARAVFRPGTAGVRALDGAWWPRSRDLTAELPALVAALTGNGFEPARVAYNPQTWDAAGRKVAVAERTIRLGWFRTIDPHLVSVTGLDRWDRADLLVVPFDSDPGVADRAFARVLGGYEHEKATVMLAAVQQCPPGGNTRRPSGSAAVDVWESEGGSRGRDMPGRGVVVKGQPHERVPYTGTTWRRRPATPAPR
ncbi:DUF5994 family protein [Haloactinopolyspora alba]|uniref:DUF5994 family protein n=1 Tax=Haloactinopolyspora alba TaxID=648780 RepID=UPI0013EBFDD5|nr:DUF5994 family protein [Haloactinopolyspora alba]